MTKRIFNIVRPREYLAGDGQTKTAWDRHGVLIVDNKKLSIHLDSIPTGEWNGWFNVYERQDEQQTRARQGRGDCPEGDGHEEGIQQEARDHPRHGVEHEWVYGKD